MKILTNTTLAVSSLALLFFSSKATVALAQAGLVNPIGSANIQQFLISLLDVAVIIAIPIVVFFVIYSGFLYVTARGNAEQVAKATRSLTYSVIGGILVIGAVAITTIIRNLVSSF